MKNFDLEGLTLKCGSSPDHERCIYDRLYQRSIFSLSKPTVHAHNSVARDLVNFENKWHRGSAGFSTEVLVTRFSHADKSKDDNELPKN